MGMEGENRLCGEPERNEIDGSAISSVVLGGSLFGGEKGQRPSAPATPRLRRNGLLREGSSPGRAETHPLPWGGSGLVLEPGLKGRARLNNY